MRVLVAAHTCNGVGDGSFVVSSAVFLTRVSGLSPARVGLTLSLAWATGFALATPLGHLADRAGLRRSAVLFALVTASTLALAAVAVGSAAALAGLLVLYAVAQSALGGTRSALLAAAVPAPWRVVARARVQRGVNAGIGAGAALGGLALGVGTPAAFRAVLAFDALTFVAAAAVLARLPVPPPVATAAAVTGGAARWRSGVLGDRPYVAAAALSGVLHLYLPMLSVLLPLWIVRRTAAPGWTVAVLFVVNTTGVLLLQVRAARSVRDLPGAARALRRAGLALLAACLVLGASGGPRSVPAAVAVLVAGACLQVVGEVLLAAGSWHVGFALADPRRPGQWQGLYSSGVPMARAIGPVVLTLVAGWDGPGWALLGAVLAVAGLLAGPVTAWGGRDRDLAVPRPGRPLVPAPVPGASGTRRTASTSASSSG